MTKALGTLDHLAVTGPADHLDALILNLLPAAVYVCDATGVVVRHNQGAERIWQRPADLGETGEACCRTIRFFHADGRPMPYRETPMGESLLRQQAVRDREVLAELPGGQRTWWQVNVEAVRSGDGAFAGTINCLHDITPRRKSIEKLQESHELLRAIIETTPECVKIVGRDGVLTHMNRAGLDMVEAGRIEDVVGGSTFSLIAPEHREAWRRYHERVCAGECLSWEFEIIGLNGGRRYVETRAVPLSMPDGDVVHLAVTRDVTERKRHEHQQRLLHNELNHRVKNTLATVQSLVAQTMRNAEDQASAQASVNARIGALARAHDLLTKTSWEGADMREVVITSVSGFCHCAERLSVEGPDIQLKPKTALSLAMALHEMVTNAIKYGALSNDQGRVAIRWAVHRGPEEPERAAARTLRFSWREYDGPAVTAPARRGFGSRLIEKGIAAELRARVQMDFPPDGLVCEIEFPLPTMTGEG